MRAKTSLSLATKIYVGLAFLYTISLFFLPSGSASQTQLHLTNAQYEWMLLALRIPVVIMWCLLFYAYRNMYIYTQSIKDTPEGEHFVHITRGLMFIVWGFLLPSVVAVILTAIAHADARFVMYNVVFTNFAYAIVSLLGFNSLSRGAYRIARQSNVQPSTSQIQYIVFGFVCVGVLFCYLISHKLSGQAFNSYNAYYLPNVVVWVSIVVPYLYAWFLGVFSALELILVARATPGIIYKRALQNVASGIVVIIAAMICLQYFRSVIPRHGHLTLGVSIGMTYIIYVLTAAGSLIMGAGAHRLKQIEEI